MAIPRKVNFLLVLPVKTTLLPLNIHICNHFLYIHVSEGHMAESCTIHIWSISFGTGSDMMWKHILKKWMNKSRSYNVIISKAKNNTDHSHKLEIEANYDYPKKDLSCFWPITYTSLLIMHFQFYLALSKW